VRHSKRSLEGVLLIDNRAGAPVPAFDGTVPIASGAVFESATLTCSHCHKQLILNPDRSRSRGYCPKCDHYLCDQCETVRVKTGECTPLNAVFDQLQNAALKNLI
jgi:hypothetical protein